MSHLSRRRFIKQSAAASAAFSTFTISGTKASGRVLGANDTIRVAVAGINGRGGNHMDAFASMENVEVSHLVDPDSRLFDSRSGRVEQRQGSRPTCTQDVREVLDDDSVDVVSVATPNHWHSLMTIWACQAEKDVYVEKPLSHNVFEGRKCVEAARKYNRIVQHGTQQRSNGGQARQMDAIHSGRYGQLLVSKGYCCKPRWSIGTQAASAPPEALDFNIWLGPAPDQPYHRNLVHYNWHWFWDTGCGDIGNQGVHEMDVARWAIDGGTLPNRVWSLGGRFIPDGADQGETPNMQLAVMEFDETILLFETRGLVGKEGAPPRKVANEFYTTEGVIRGGKFYPNGSDQGENLTGGEASVTGGGPFGSFIAAVRSRNVDDCNADVEVGHYSSALCHLSNVSYRLGKAAPFDSRSRSLGDNTQTVEAFDDLKENLRAVNIDLDEATYIVGRDLQFDPETERFVDDDEANALLTRNYRAPFVVPNEV